MKVAYADRRLLILPVGGSVNSSPSIIMENAYLKELLES
jgi:hypothetical protein